MIRRCERISRYKIRRATRLCTNLNETIDWPGRRSDALLTWVLGCSTAYVGPPANCVRLDPGHFAIGIADNA